MTMMEKRYENLRAIMREKGIDALYINSPENHLYVSGFDNPDGWLFVTLEKIYVFADFRYTEAAKAEAAPHCTVCLPGKPSFKEIAEECGAKVVGYEDRRTTCANFNWLKKQLEGVNVEYAPVGGLFTDLRDIKTPEEVESIIAAQRIAEGAFDHLLKVINYNMTEIEVAAELEYYMKKNGSEKPSFDTIAVSGTASARPHGVPRKCRLEKGFLTMDYGAVVNGYHSDMTRTIVIGKADADVKKVYDTVLAAQLAAIEVAAEGVKNADCDKAERNIINAAGYEGCFGHGLGHGVGLEIHETPSVSGGAGDRTLIAGEIITVEPGIYIEGKYGCRIEDMLYIEANGKKTNLTNCPKEMIEI